MYFQNYHDDDDNDDLDYHLSHVKIDCFVLSGSRTMFGASQSWPLDLIHIPAAVIRNILFLAVA